MKLKLLLLAICFAFPMVLGLTSIAGSYAVYDSSNMSVAGDSFSKKYDFSSRFDKTRFGFTRELFEPYIIDSKRNKDASLPKIWEEYVETDAQLSAYLKYLNNDIEPTVDSFSSFRMLVFDGSNEVCNEIVNMVGLFNFNFTSLVELEIKGMSKLEFVNIKGIYNLRAVFPNLKRIIINNCNKLNNLQISNTSGLESLTIKDCSDAVLKIDDISSYGLLDLKIERACKGFVLSNLFSNLQRFECVENDIKSIDASLYNLEYAKIVGNKSLAEIKLVSSELRRLELNKNENLQVLDLSGANNINNWVFDTMDFEENQAIVTRNLVYAPHLRKVLLSSNNWLREFDISKSPEIEIVILSDCTNLEKLHLASELSNLNILDLTHCYVLEQLNISSAINVSTLLLEECNLLKNVVFENLNYFTNLQYVNLYGTGLQAINFEDLLELQVLVIGSLYLTDVSVANLPKLYQFEIKESNHLRTMSLNNLARLERFDIDECGNIEKIMVVDVALNEFKVYDKQNLKTIELGCENLQSLLVYDCGKLGVIDFSKCTDLTTVEIQGCALLEEKSLDGFKNLGKIREITVSECNKIHSFAIEDKASLSYLNLKNLNNLIYLKISNINNSVRIFLPNKTGSLKNLVLTKLNGAQFGVDVLDLSNSVLSSVEISGVPFLKINLNNNLIASVKITSVKMLKEIDLSYNKITDILPILQMLDTCHKLEVVNINNNRIDLSKDNELNILNESVYANYIILGVQNIIANNTYTYEPKIYYGGMGSKYANIRAVCHYAGIKYKKTEISDATLKRFSRSYLMDDHFKTCKSGTYYITFEKFDSSGNILKLTEDEKRRFLPIYFMVSKEFDFIKFIWIIFLAVAGAIFIYIGISWFVERKKKTKLLNDDDYDDGIIDGGTKLSQKEIKIAEREHRKMFKENNKLYKQELKNQIVMDKQRLKDEKENQKSESEKGKTVTKEDTLKEFVGKQKLSKGKTELESGEVKGQKNMKTTKDKAKDKALKKEQKMLRRMEKQNLRAEKRREKMEERGIFVDEKERKTFKRNSKQNSDDFEVEFPTLNKATPNDDFIDGGISDKDLADIISSRSTGNDSSKSARPPKLPPKLKQ